MGHMGLKAELGMVVSKKGKFKVKMHNDLCTARLEVLRWSKKCLWFLLTTFTFFVFLMFIPVLLVEMIIVCLFWTCFCFHLFQIQATKLIITGVLTPEFSADVTPPKKH